MDPLMAGMKRRNDESILNLFKYLYGHLLVALDL